MAMKPSQIILSARKVLKRARRYGNLLPGPRRRAFARALGDLDLLLAIAHDATEETKGKVSIVVHEPGELPKVIEAEIEDT